MKEHSKWGSTSTQNGVLLTPTEYNHRTRHPGRACMESRRQSMEHGTINPTGMASLAMVARSLDRALRAGLCRLRVTHHHGAHIGTQLLSNRPLAAFAGIRFASASSSATSARPAAARAMGRWLVGTIVVGSVTAGAVWWSTRPGVPWSVRKAIHQAKVRLASLAIQGHSVWVCRCRIEGPVHVARANVPVRDARKLTPLVTTIKRNTAYWERWQS